MFRINLLPQEVLERRRYEGWYRWVFILAGGLISIILGIYVLLLFEVSSKNAQLQTIQESATAAEDDRRAALDLREQGAGAAGSPGCGADRPCQVASTIGQVAEDVSLVLPDEVWLDLLTINESTGIVLTADTPRNAGESNDVAYKSVAKTLVRLNELPELYDVWLTTAVNGQWAQWAPSVGDETAALPVNVVTFGATTKVVKPAATTAPAGSASTTSTTTPAAAAQGAVNSANSAGTQ